MWCVFVGWVWLETFLYLNCQVLHLMGNFSAIFSLNNLSVLSEITIMWLLALFIISVFIPFSLFFLFLLCFKMHLLSLHIIFFEVYINTLLHFSLYSWGLWAAVFFFLFSTIMNFSLSFLFLGLTKENGSNSFVACWISLKQIFGIVCQQLKLINQYLLYLKESKNRIDDTF